MKYNTSIGIIFLLAIMCLACKKQEDRTCWKAKGENTTITINQSSISQLNLYDDMNLILINDSLEVFTIEGPENLIKLIDFNSDHSELTIRNTNTCNFLRVENEINLYYHYKDIEQINLFGYGTLTNQHKIKHPITVHAYQAFSSIDLTIENVNSNFIIFNGSTELKVQGNCNHLYCYNSGLGPVKCANIEAQKAHINSNTIASSQISVVDTLIVEINSYGNLYYSGNPSTTLFTITGEGKIIHL